MKPASPQRPVSVLHLVRSMRVGGLENVVVNLCQGLRRHGFESRIGCLLDAGEWLSAVGGGGHWIGDLDRNGPARTLQSLCRYLRENQVTLLHTHNAHPHKYGAAATILTRVPLVHTKHGRNWPDNWKWVWFSRQLSRFTKTVVPVSRDIERIVTDIEKVPSSKVTTVVNGVDTERFAPRQVSRERLGLTDVSFVIGSVGRYSPEKQYSFLVRAFALFHAVHSDAKLVLVGDGPVRADIEAAARACNLERDIVLTGMQANTDEWLNAMDVFCLSSDQEGTSITLLEAGASGIPSVVTDVGGNGEVVQDGETGIVVPFGDEQKLADAFSVLAADDVCRTQMGAAARKRICENYSQSRMVERYVDVYRRVLENTRKGIMGQQT